MNPHLQRGALLYEQSRHEQAEAELRQALALEPGEPHAHSLLALCLAEREDFKGATDEAQQAIHLAPDYDFAHYALARVLCARNREDEALTAINEAIRLDPSDADYLALLAQIQLRERRWPAALEAAERGLQHDPEHVACNNLRAIALVKLGRREEAGATIQAALHRNPDNSLTHANQGWALLEAGKPYPALEHFRESLRLDPENDWARRGIVEALKARNFIYALMLKYFLWIGKFRRNAQWGIIVGAYVGNQVINTLARTNPHLAPWLLPLRIAYVTFALMTWLASPLFNLMLRLNRFGRYALSREQTVHSNWIGLFLLLTVISLGGCLYYGRDSLWILSAVFFGFLLLPVSGIFNCPTGWPRWSMIGYTALTAAFGLATMAMLIAEDAKQVTRPPGTPDPAGEMLNVFLFAAVLSGWAVNFLAMQRRRR